MLMVTGAVAGGEAVGQVGERFTDAEQVFVANGLAGANGLIRNSPFRQGRILEVPVAALLLADVAHEPAAAVTVKNAALAEGRITNQTIRAGQAIRDRIPARHREALPDLADRSPPATAQSPSASAAPNTGGKRLDEGIGLTFDDRGREPSGPG